MKNSTSGIHVYTYIYLPAVGPLQPSRAMYVYIDVYIVTYIVIKPQKDRAMIYQDFTFLFFWVYTYIEYIYMYILIVYSCQFYS